MTIQIRQAKPSDSKAVSQMIMESIEHFHAENYSAEEIAIWKRGYTAETVKEQVETHKSLILIIEESCGGFIQFHPPEIKAFYLSPKFMGKGYGKQLLQQLLEELKTAGFKRVELTSTPHVKGFYINCGFQVEKEITTYWEGHPFQEYGMWKDL